MITMEVASERLGEDESSTSGRHLFPQIDAVRGLRASYSRFLISLGRHWAWHRLGGARATFARRSGTGHCSGDNQSASRARAASGRAGRNPKCRSQFARAALGHRPLPSPARTCARGPSPTGRRRHRTQAPSTPEAHPHVCIAGLPMQRHTERHEHHARPRRMRSAWPPWRPPRPQGRPTARSSLPRRRAPVLVHPHGLCQLGWLAVRCGERAFTPQPHACVACVCALTRRVATKATLPHHGIRCEPLLRSLHPNRPSGHSWQSKAARLATCAGRKH